MTSTIQPAQADAASEGTMLSVVGVGRTSQRPDRAQVSVGVVAEAPTAGAAMELLNRSMENVLSAVKKLELPGQLVTTAGLSLSPQYDYSARRDNQPPRIVGYIAQNTVSVRVDDPEAVGQVIDRATAAGANQVQGVSFQLRDPEAAQREALRAAVGQARAKAEVVAQAMGMRIVEVVQVIESGAASPPPGPMLKARGMMMEAAAAPGAAIEPGELDIQASLTMIVRLGV